MTTKSTLAQNIAFAVIAIAYVLMTIWFINPAWLQGMLIRGVSIAPASVIAFFFSGIIVHAAASAAQQKPEGIPEILLPTCILILLLLLTKIVLTALLEIETSVGSFLGQPSLAEIVGFFLVVLVGVNAMIWLPGSRLRLQWLGVMITAIGCLALLGYMTNIGWFYYSIEGFSSPMALQTAGLFTLVGAGLLHISSRSQP